MTVNSGYTSTLTGTMYKVDGTSRGTGRTGTPVMGQTYGNNSSFSTHTITGLSSGFGTH